MILPSVQLTPGTRVALYADDIPQYREKTNRSDYDSLQTPSLCGLYPITLI